jgi:hypothetical protein
MATATKQHEIDFEIDGETVETTSHTLTVGEILNLAHLDPTTHYLIEIRGNNQIKHTESTEPIKLHKKMKFISVFTGPTPIS